MSAATSRRRGTARPPATACSARVAASAGRRAAVHLAPSLRCQGCQGLPRRTEPLLSGPGPCGSDAQVDTTTAAGRVGRAAACRGGAHGPRAARGRPWRWATSTATASWRSRSARPPAACTRCAGRAAWTRRAFRSARAGASWRRCCSRRWWRASAAGGDQAQAGLRLVVQSHDGHLYAISGASGAPQRSPLALGAARARGGCGPCVPLAMHQGVACISSTG